MKKRTRRAGRKFQSRRMLTRYFREDSSAHYHEQIGVESNTNETEYDHFTDPETTSADPSALWPYKLILVDDASYSSFRPIDIPLDDS